MAGKKQFAIIRAVDVELHDTILVGNSLFTNVVRIEELTPGGKIHFHFAADTPLVLQPQFQVGRFIQPVAHRPKF